MVLEVLPKAIFNKQADETRFYEKFFARAMVAEDLQAILTFGEKEAASSGLGAMDALHLAAAHFSRAAAFIMTEKPNKRIHRFSLVKAVYLFSVSLQVL